MVSSERLNHLSMNSNNLSPHRLYRASAKRGQINSIWRTGANNKISRIGKVVQQEVDKGQFQPAFIR